LLKFFILILSNFVKQNLIPNRYRTHEYAARDFLELKV